MELGLGSPSEFWRQTPRLFDLAVRAAVRRTRNEARARMSAAWWSAAFERSKEMPPLEKVLAGFDEPAAKPVMRPADVRAVMTRWRFVQAAAAGDAARAKAVMKRGRGDG